MPDQTLTRLVDLTNASIGSVVIGVPKDAGYSLAYDTVAAGGDDLVGDQVIDNGPAQIGCYVTGEDPMSVPLVAALTASQVVQASSRVANSGTYDKFNVAHAVLTGIDLTIRDMQSATAKFDFKNRGSFYSNNLIDELTTGTGIAGATAARDSVVRIARTGHSFTPDGGLAQSMISISGITWSAKAQPLVHKPSPGSKFYDVCDVGGWRITGSITIADQTGISSSAIGEYLCTLGRGTLCVQLQLAGFSGGGTPPADQVIGLYRIQFSGTQAARKRGTDPAETTVNFNAVLRAADGTAMALADMIDFAAAA